MLCTVMYQFCSSVYKNSCVYYVEQWAGKAIYSIKLKLKLKLHPLCVKKNGAKFEIQFRIQIIFFNSTTYTRMDYYKIYSNDTFTLKN